MGALLVLLLTAVGPSNLYADIVNGDFEAGNTGFSSSYTYVSPGFAPGGPYPLGMWAEGTYTVDTIRTTTMTFGLRLGTIPPAQA